MFDTSKISNFFLKSIRFVHSVRCTLFPSFFQAVQDFTSPQSGKVYTVQSVQNVHFSEKNLKFLTKNLFKIFLDVNDVLKCRTKKELFVKSLWRVLSEVSNMPHRDLFFEGKSFPQLHKYFKICL